MEFYWQITIASLSVEYVTIEMEKSLQEFTPCASVKSYHYGLYLCILCIINIVIEFYWQITKVSLPVEYFMMGMEQVNKSITSDIRAKKLTLQAIWSPLSL